MWALVYDYITNTKYKLSLNRHIYIQNIVDCARTFIGPIQIPPSGGGGVKNSIKTKKERLKKKSLPY